MKIKPLGTLFILVLSGVFVWIHGAGGMQDASEAVPVAVAFPLYYWLASPWRWLPEPRFRHPEILIAGLILFLGGIVTDFTILMAAGWVMFLALYQSVFLEKVPRRFLILPLLGFPWLTQDLESLGWFFRYSGAGAVQVLFTLLGFTVHREGTLLLIRDLPLSVEPACAGLNILQSLLVIGSFLICMRVAAGWRFILAFLLLIPLAWVANTFRIFMLGCSGLLFGSDFARNWFHSWGSWLVLCAMFFMCQGLLTLFGKKRKETV